MSYFEQICGKPGDNAVPDRVYAWVDAPSALSEDGFTRLDCIDADWADRRELGAGILASGELGEEPEAHVSMVFWREQTGEEDEGRIVELRLGERAPTDEADALHYLNLTAAAIPRRVAETRWPDREEEARLASVTEFPQGDASDSDVEGVLAVASTEVNAVAVYDVGQGSCSALLASDFPRLYFDMGRGSNGDAGTFPKGFTGLCTTYGVPTWLPAFGPPVVLSHWHVDHWAMAKHFGGRILSSLWVVPRQPKMGPASATLAGVIAARGGQVLVRSQGAPTLRAGAVSLHSCTGSNLNDSGLAMVVWGPDELPIGLPGDAHYRHIADFPDELLSLVVAHHGGHTRARAAEIPKPMGDPAGRLVVSAGPRNTYKHPRLDPIREHASAWQSTPWLSTSERHDKVDPEHVHLYWDQGSPAVVPPCGSTNCTLAAARR